MTSKDPAITEDGHAGTSFVHRSTAMKRGLAFAAEAAASEAVVLLVGEPGTGRKRMARHVHDSSPRRGRPLLLVDATLFSASFERRLRDAFLSANHGGVVLQNTDLSPTNVVPTMLEAIRTHAARGSRYGVTAGARVFLTTAVMTNGWPNSPVARALIEDRVPALVPLPALRERGPDIQGLVEEFLAELSEERGRDQTCGVSADALDSLERHPWPENVRQLKDVLHRALVMVNRGGSIDVTHLPRTVRAASEPSSASELTLAEVEERHILATLRRLGGHREATARALGISVSTLARRLQEYGVAREPGTLDPAARGSASDS